MLTRDGDGVRTALVPVLIVVILPGLWLLDRSGLMRRPAIKVGAAVLGLAILIWSLPYGGLGLGDQKQLMMLLAGAAVAVIALWGIDRWSRRRALAWLGATTVLAGLTYLNFFAFHGGGTWVHLHDVAHYYLGAKYAAEVGYDDLYVAALRAEAELYDDHFHTLNARDLATNQLVDIRQLLRASEPVKARFDAARWRDFKADVALFRDRLGPLWAGVLSDHGYNATPPFTLVARTIANRVPAGNATGVLLLTLLDPLLLVIATAAAAWGFGPAGALLAALHFLLVYGAGFAWTGGALLRFGWFCALIAGLACLARQRWRSAGALLAVASALRLFPAAFAVGVMLHGVWASRAVGRPSRRHLRFAAAFAVTLALLVCATFAAGAGRDRWSEFTARIDRQVETLSPNLVGLTQLLALRPGPAQVTQDELVALEARRSRLYRWQLAIVGPVALALCLAAARRRDAVEASLLGIPLLLAATNLASYDGVILVGLTLAWRAAPRALILILGVELASYVLALFADREAAVFALRTVLLVMLVTALYITPPGDSDHTGPGCGRPKK